MVARAGDCGGVSLVAWLLLMKHKLGSPMKHNPFSLSSGGLLGFSYGFWSLVCGFLILAGWRD